MPFNNLFGCLFLHVSFRKWAVLVFNFYVEKYFIHILDYQTLLSNIKEAFSQK